MPDHRPPHASATDQVQAGYAATAPHSPAVPPIYQSNAFEFASLSQARARFALREEGDIYSRAANPTVAVFEERVAALEGGVAAAGVSSGQAVVALALLALARAGDHIVAANQLYGGRVDLLGDTFAGWGIDVTFVDQDDPDAWTAAVRPETKAFFAESITNPLAQVLDTRRVADLAHSAGVPLVIDNTVATPILQRVKDFGADISVHSATKYLGGHGSALGGAIVDLGTFDFGADPERFPQLNEPYGRVRGGSLVDRFGAKAYITLVKTKYSHDLGPSLSAFNAFQLLQGLETLDLRIARHSASALAVARFLDAHPAVARVHHPGLESSPWHALALSHLPKGAAAVFSFDLHSTGDPEQDFAQVERVISQLDVVKLVANIGDARSLIAHPASMTHSHMTPQQLADSGIAWTTVRLSIGLEDPADILHDLDRALAVAPSAADASGAADAGAAADASGASEALATLEA